jgi:hypothetical protein
MIRYRFNIGNVSNIAYLDNDDSAKNMAEFINADWERDTIIIHNSCNNFNYRVEIEIGDNDIFLLSKLKIIDVKTWNT